jgi:hypothetical protein
MLQVFHTFREKTILGNTAKRNYSTLFFLFTSPTENNKQEKINLNGLVCFSSFMNHETSGAGHELITGSLSVRRVL